jgi:flavodoxin
MWRHRKKNKKAAMKNALMITIMAGLILISGCSNAQSSANNVLIVYLSRTNNTKVIAEIIQQNIGGKLVALDLETPYPENYQQTVQQVVKENETNYLPPLKTKIDSIEKYDVVFVGFPTWDMKMPPPMKSFLKQYNLKGKTIIPFNTNAGYGVGSSFKTVSALCPDSKVLDGFDIKAGAEKDGQFLVIKGEKAIEAETKVKTWLQKIKVITKTP